jgi:hypothetical protein
MPSGAKKKLILLEYNGALKFIEEEFSAEYEVTTIKYPMTFLTKIVSEKYDMIVVDYLNPLIPSRVLKEKLDTILGIGNYYVLAHDMECAAKKFETTKLIEYKKFKEGIANV